MKKVVFQTNNMSEAGGAERVISIWANYFAEKYHVHIISGIEKKSFYQLNEKIEEVFCDFGYRYRIYPILRLINIGRFMGSLKYGDTLIVNKYNFTNSLWLLRSLKLFKNINLVYFSHGGTSDFLNFYSKYRTKKIFKTYDKVICLHNDLETESNLINYEKLNIISNPVTFKSKSICDYNKKQVLIVGRLSKEKGIDLLLKAWSKITYLDFKLVIVGDGPMEKELKGLAEKLQIEDSVSFEGAQKNVEKYFLNASIYTMTSHYEGMPMVILEAMECGLPIIAYKNDGIKNIIKENGFLISDFNEDIFVEKMNMLISNSELRAKMGGHSKEISKNYQIENIVEKFEEVL